MADPSAPTAEFRGTVGIRSEVEREWNVTGTITLRMERYPEGLPKQRWIKNADLADGVFTISSQPDDWFTVESAEIDGRPATFRGNGYRVGDGAAELQAWLDDQWLEIVDADTGHQLSDIEVIRMMWDDEESESSPSASEEAYYFRQFALHPTAWPGRTTVRSGATSPIDLGVPNAEERGGQWFARAAGYGWLPFVIDPTDHPTLRLEMRRASTLRVTTIGAPREPAALLRILLPVWAGFEHAATAFEVPADPDQPTFVLAGLNPMKIHVAVEIGRRGFSGHLILADSGPLTLLPGKTTHVTLQCDAAPEIPKRVPLSGTVTIPAEWSLDARAGRELVMRLEAIDPVADVAGTTPDVTLTERAAGLFHFDAGLVLPGRFKVTFFGPVEWTTRLEVGPGGDRDQRIEIPPPTTLRVEVDGVLGEAGVLWGSGAAEGDESAALISSSSFSSAGKDGPPFSLQVPTGSVTVEAWDFGVSGACYRSARRTIDARPGHNELRISLDRSTGVRVLLNQPGFVRLEGEAGQRIRGQELTQPSGESPWFWQSVTYLDPGRWIVTPQLADPDAPPVEKPTIVDVPEGKMVELKIDVERPKQRSH